MYTVLPRVGRDYLGTFTHLKKTHVSNHHCQKLTEKIWITISKQKSYIFAFFKLKICNNYSGFTIGCSINLVADFSLNLKLKTVIYQKRFLNRFSLGFVKKRDDFQYFSYGKSTIFWKLNILKETHALAASPITRAIQPH